MLRLLELTNKQLTNQPADLLPLTLSTHPYSTQWQWAQGLGSSSPQPPTWDYVTVRIYQIKREREVTGLPEFRDQGGCYSCFGVFFSGVRNVWDMLGPGGYVPECLFMVMMIMRWLLVGLARQWDICI